MHEWLSEQERGEYYLPVVLQEWNDDDRERQQKVQASPFSLQSVRVLQCSSSPASPAPVDFCGWSGEHRILKLSVVDLGFCAFLLVGAHDVALVE